MDTRTETVIIPHPNELKKIADIQKRLIHHLQSRGAGAELWMPLFPPYLRSLPPACAPISCVITSARAEKNRVVLDAFARADTQTVSLTLPIARRLIPEESAATESAEHVRALDARADFPLVLPVFRIARVTFRIENARLEWEVDESVWVKAAKAR